MFKWRLKILNHTHLAWIIILHPHKGFWIQQMTLLDHARTRGAPGRATPRNLRRNQSDRSDCVQRCGPKAINTVEFAFRENGTDSVNPTGH